MLSRFGKSLRKIRIDHSMTLGDLGSSMKLSAAFLSALERGKPVPPNFIEKLTHAIHLKPAEIKELELAAAQQTKEITLNVENRSDSTRELAVAFARSFQSMSDEELRRILEPISSR
jgi:transcriptional regulator with XRE-family HTH domain